ncbi:DUF4340 domain-containing protein [Pseudomonas mangrovi]|uniref:DUF4340 domain-containing protein n=1 Tax=Pseudomonas mangrovi TaxID=2161748 RepID=A0A2T5PCU5_9PSED|nr:DUF4340 domain-containing protein [Pseudomonas mangrovi]PTU75534.1 hypothetical protein DBO85_05180 [Pseudomonas mangrovi]
MGRKALVFLALLALLLGASYLWLQRDGQPQDDGREAWLPELKGRAAQVALIEVQVGNEPAVRLAREGDHWVLPAKEGYAAASPPLADLLKALLEAEKVEARTANPQLHARLGLAEEGETGERASRVRIEFGGAAAADAAAVDTSPGADAPGAGAPLDLRVGNPSSQGAGQLVRRAGEEQVWLISRNIPLPATELDWLDRRVTSIAFADVRELDVRYASGEQITVYRDEQAQPNLKVRQLPKDRALPFEAAANGMATLFANLRLSDALPLAQLSFDREKPALRFTLQTFDEGRLEGQVYRHGEEYWMTLPVREGLSAEQVPGREQWAFRIEAQHYQALAKRLPELLGEN